MENGQQQTREMLMEKGFPKKVIADMRDDEVADFTDDEWLANVGCIQNSYLLELNK